MKVTKYTRAGHNGKEILCPKCNHKTTVYHFIWYAIKCEGCGEFIDKLNWIKYDTTGI